MFLPSCCYPFKKLNLGMVLTPQNGGFQPGPALTEPSGSVSFTRSFYGALPQSCNDMDNMFHGCHFADNAVGVSTTHGNFYIMDTHFECSNITDTFKGGCGGGPAPPPRHPRATAHPKRGRPAHLLTPLLRHGGGPPGAAPARPSGALSP
jgi:hypothetical protein